MKTERARGRGRGGGGWSGAQRVLHWSNAALVLAAFLLAWVMVRVPLAALLLKFVLFQVHKTLGILAFLAVIARLALRAGRGRPAPEAGLPRWQVRAAAGAQAALYALLVVTPVLGYLTASLAQLRIPTLFLGVIPLPPLTGPDAAWFRIIFPLHRACAIALVVLAAGHAAAAIRHHLLGRAVLRAMWRG